MKRMLTSLLNWLKQLSRTKKIILGLVTIFFIAPVLIFLSMLLLIFVPFIAIIAAIVLLILSFIKKNKAKDYRISSVISLVIAVVSIFAFDSLFGSESETKDETDADANSNPVVLESHSEDAEKEDTDESEVVNLTTPVPVDESSNKVEEKVEETIEEGKIHFINTGNSDAILIENAGKFAMIDTGNTNDDATVKSYLKNQGVEKLDYLILTHFHADHIGSADTVITDFEVATTLVPNGDATTQVYQDYINALSSKGLQPSVPLEGATFDLGSAILTIYNTAGGNSNENNDSLIVLYENGEDRAVFMGDAEAEVESKLAIGDVDLLKVGHHGSNTSSSTAFINNITPEYAVILVGQPNQYGHPSQETLNLFKSKDIPVYRTDEQGDIVFTSTGHGFETQLSPGSYTPGKDNSSTSSSNTGTSSSSTSSSNSSTSGSSTSSSNSSTSGSSSGSKNYKDDNPNGIYNQESTAPKESYKNCTLLREVYPDGVPQGHPAYESKHDRDKDGWACER